MTGKGKGKDEAASIERSSEQRDAVERRASSSSSSTCKSDTISPKTKTTLVNAGYWADWTASTLPPENIDFTKFDFINFAFALPTVDFDLSFNSEASKSLLKRLVTAAHNGDTKVALSIGGWGGSTYFSTAVRTNSSRATFISNIKKIYSTYSLDGIDIDWEYPGQSTEGSQYDAMDAKNLQSFFQELRVALPDAMLSAAVTHRPFIGSKGVPITNVKRSAEALDYILIMNYDVWGSSSVPGSNSPLANLCGNSTMPSASAAAGVKAWSAAGMPREKILLGIPAYGYINTSTKKTLQTRKVGRRGVTLTSSDGSTYSGQINFKAIVDQGALVKDSSGLYDEAGGFIKYWDDCSDTPYLSNGNIVVTYDDTSSIWDKGAFAAKAGIAGLNMWSLDGDNNWDLTKAAIAGMRSGYASLSS
ncbi:glycoside hydrolase [Violaceomyces palustris]|uniref:Glycoside hydrolase n=1 Tax=Violaceomyces palustris TaxID=1673888 RepID=A0ACD0P8A2_9BASI|nr:glycoside hydrolase [Violaceomyces palustris]